MSVSAISSQTSSSQIQELLALMRASKGSGEQSGLSLGDTSGDTVSFSAAGRKLSQPPAEIADQLRDLFTDRKNVKEDLAKLKSFFESHPDELKKAQEMRKQASPPEFGGSGFQQGVEELNALLDSLTSKD